MSNERRSSGGGGGAGGGGKEGSHAGSKYTAKSPQFTRAKPPQDGEHPLEFEWVYWHLGKPGASSPGGSRASYTPKAVGSFSTVEGFWQYAAHVVLPSRIPVGHTLHLFKGGIAPKWEDKSNEGGGRWEFQLAHGHERLDAVWQELTMAAVGETLEEDRGTLCGIVLARRKPMDKIAVWLRAGGEAGEAKKVGGRVAALLMAQDPAIKLTFQTHAQEREQPNRRRQHTSTSPPSSASSGVRSSAPSPSSAPTSPLCSRNANVPPDASPSSFTPSSSVVFPPSII